MTKSICNNSTWLRVAAAVALVVAFGAFLPAFAGYSRVEWIKGNGSAWIRTGYKPAATDRVVMKFRLARVDSSNEFMFCSRGTSTTANMFCGLRLGTNLRMDYGTGTENQKTIGSPDTASTYVMTLDGKNKKGRVENESGTLLGSEVAFAASAAMDSELALFASHTAGAGLTPSSTMANYGTFTMYWCKVYDSSGTLVRCWVPAVDESAHDGDVAGVGVLDLCNDRFWPCIGTGRFAAGGKTLPGSTVNRVLSMSGFSADGNGGLKVGLSFARHGFPQRLFAVCGDEDCGATTNGWSHVEALDDVTASETSRTVSFSAAGTTFRYLRFISQAAIPGAQPVEYLESSGADEYIDTGFCPNGNSRADLSFRLVKQITADADGFIDPFGSRVGNTYQMHAVTGVNRTEWDGRWGNCSSMGYSDTVAVVGDHFFSYNSRSYNFDGAVRTFGPEFTFPARTEYPCYVFAVNNTGTPRFFCNMRLRSLDIWDEGELARSYTPCVMDDGTPAMYDAVHGTFARQASGTTALTFGDVVWSATDVIDLASPLTAEWNAEAVDGDLSNSANWICRDGHGAVLSGAVPTDVTEVRMAGTLDVSIPQGAAFSFRTLELDVTLSGDCDWSGLGGSEAISGSVNLNGHALTVSSLPANCRFCDSSVPPVIAEKALFWLDAADESTLSADAAGNVTAWASKAGDRRAATVRDARYKPTYSKDAYARPCVDFGEFFLSGLDGKDMTLGQFSNVRTAFFVLKIHSKGFLAGSATTGCYEFHRGSNGAYAHTQYSKIAQVWNGTESVALSDVLPDDSFEVVTVKLSENGHVDSLASDRYGQDEAAGNYRLGGRQLCEIVLFGEGAEPTDAERLEVQRYLKSKWDGGAGGTLRVNVATGVVAKNTVDSFGSARLVKDGSGALVTPSVQFAAGVEVNGGSLNACGSSTTGRVAVAETASITGLTLLDGATLDIGGRRSAIPSGAIAIAAGAEITIASGGRAFRRNGGAGEKILDWSAAPSGVSFTPAKSASRYRLVVGSDGLYAVGGPGTLIIVR